jgi:hypothetical protein
VDAGRFLETYRGHVLIRIMQAMGAYGYRGFFERKPRFLESVPFAARNVAGLLESGLPVELPELESVFLRIVEAWADRPGPIAPLAGLTVHVTSFSYRQGLPADETGHGGGFVFDCRALPNPGRFPEYAGVDGRQAPVAAFLETLPETEAFWSHTHPLVDAHIESFQGRGFSDLSVAFGCTGGQHRSVYFAERLARHIRQRHPDVMVQLEHSEEAKWPAPEAGPPPSAAAAAAGPAPQAALSAQDEPWTQ